MKVKTKYLSLAFVLLIASLNFCHASQAGGQHSEFTNISNELEGRWSPNCDSLEGIKIGGNFYAEFTINSNQIIVGTLLRQGDGKIGVVNVYFDSPLDLGRGGMNLNWGNFSKSTPIAVMKVRDKNNFDLSWIGFYDNKARSRKWAKQPDFYEENGGAINFHRCAN